MDVNNVMYQRARAILAKIICAVSSAQCNMAFSAENDVLSVERHVTDLNAQYEQSLSCSSL
jgi:hypothetical protein